jgi:C4-dicarboxylate transporter DctM subunit
LLILIAFVLLLLLGLPVAFTLGILGAAILFLYLDPAMASMQIPQVMYNAMNNSLLLAIPAFILTGQVIFHSGIGSKAFYAADKWFGHFPGGLAIATVVTCAFFATMSGSSIATLLTIGYIASAEMIRNGYSKELAYGVIASAGTLGILIPPSGPMILYGAMTQESVSGLFMAGIVPGILLVLLFVLYIVLGESRKLVRRPRASWEERTSSVKEIAWFFLLPVIIIGGIYSGFFTVTESASVAFIVSLVLAAFVYRSVGWKQFFEILKNSASNTGMIMLILSSALLFGFAITIIELPQTIQAFIDTLNMNKWLMLAIIFIIYTILGMFLDVASILLIMVPIVYPVMEMLDFDLIWFGIFTVIALEMAAITPPVGLNLFVMMQVSEKQGNPMNIIQMTRAAFPYLLLMVVLMMIICLIPSLVMYLPAVTEGR